MILRCFKVFFPFLAGLLLSQVLTGQGMVQTHSRSTRIIERISLKTGANQSHHSAIQNIDKKQLARLAVLGYASDSLLNEKDLKDLDYLVIDNPAFFCTIRDSIYRNQNPLLKYFYRLKSKFYAYSDDQWQFYVNPLFDFNLSNDMSKTNWQFQNTRGLEIGGKLKKGFRFYTAIFENQRSFPEYLTKRIEERKAVPGQGFYKNYQSTIAENIYGYDYLNAKAYISADLTPAINVSFGHGKFFIGNGLRSLILSDYGNNYLFLKAETRLNRFFYQNLFAELAADSPAHIGTDQLLPKKYMASHYLSYQFMPELEIGVFESVIFSRQNGFELQYLNPIIFYRTVEQYLGSPDNILFGLNFRADLLKRVRLYGQFTLDEFRLDEFFSGDNWWGNKFGIQAGLKYIDFAGVDHLDIQVEYNRVRPFTYSHQDSVISYSHYRQPLAHPLGANFSEFLVYFSYRFEPGFFVDLGFLHADFGTDDNSTNFGGDILRTADSRLSDYGHFTGQGVSKQINQVRLKCSYSVYHNLYIDLNILYRSEKAGDQENQNYFIIGTGLRMNIEQHKPDY